MTVTIFPIKCYCSSIWNWYDSIDCILYCIVSTTDTLYNGSIHYSKYKWKERRKVLNNFMTWGLRQKGKIILISFSTAMLNVSLFPLVYEEVKSERNFQYVHLFNWNVSRFAISMQSIQLKVYKFFSTNQCLNMTFL